MTETQRESFDYLNPKHEKEIPQTALAGLGVNLNRVEYSTGAMTRLLRMTVLLLTDIVFGGHGVPEHSGSPGAGGYSAEAEEEEEEEEATIFSLEDGFSKNILSGLILFLILVTVVYEYVTDWLIEHIFKEGIGEKLMQKMIKASTLAQCNLRASCAAARFHPLHTLSHTLAHRRSLPSSSLSPSQRLSSSSLSVRCAIELLAGQCGEGYRRWAHPMCDDSLAGLQEDKKMLFEYAHVLMFATAVAYAKEIALISTQIHDITKEYAAADAIPEDRVLQLLRKHTQVHTCHTPITCI